MLAVTILGNNSAVPAFDRHPTSQVVVMEGEKFLVDCGEGTQIQLINYKIRRNKISHIFISHLHGDHYFGLVGLINTFNLLNHQQELNVYGPSPLQEIIELQLKVADTSISYPLHFHTITKEAILVDNDKVCVKCFRTNHRIECYGFSFTEKKLPRKLDPDKAKASGIPFTFFNELKKGLDFIKEDGSVVKNEWVTTEATKGKPDDFVPIPNMMNPLFSISKALTWFIMKPLTSITCRKGLLPVFTPPVNRQHCLPKKPM